MKLKTCLIMVAVFVFSILAFAQSSPSPAPNAAPALQAGGDFLSQVIGVIKSWGGFSVMLKISAIITLIIASMKVSFLNNLIWSKLGSLQIWVGPALGLLGGVFSLGVGGPVTLASIFAYVSAGGGAIYLHEFLDKIKLIPGLGAMWVSLINSIESALGGPAAQAISVQPPKV